MSNFKETLWERFFNRLPENTANEAVRVLKRGGSHRDIDYFTLKESEVSVERSRHIARQAIATYRSWKQCHSVHKLLDASRNIEGIALKRNMVSMISLYKDKLRDHCDLTWLLVTSIDEENAANDYIRQGGQDE